MKQFTPLDAMRERAERAERELAALKTELSVPSAGEFAPEITAAEPRPGDDQGPEMVCLGCGEVNNCRTIRYEVPGETVEYDIECNECGSREFEEGQYAALREVIHQRDDAIEALESSAPSSGARTINGDALFAAVADKFREYPFAAQAVQECKDRLIEAGLAAPSVPPAERVAELERQLAHAREEWKKYQDLSCQQAGELERLAASATPAKSMDDMTVQEFQGVLARANLLLQHKVLGDPSKGFTTPTCMCLSFPNACPVHRSPSDSGSDKGAP